jgi:nucleotide-binding universal stress UspA family protein
MAETPEKILIATDFSTTADRAEELAFQLARSLGAELHVVHVRVILDDPHMAEEQQLEIERLMSVGDEATREALDKARPNEPGLTVETHLVRGISAAESISETAMELGCDLIVMGTHGRRGLKHMLLGSVAEKVVRIVPIPVLTVRPDAETGAEGAWRILVPYDFSNHSATALRAASAWSAAFDGELTLLHVVEPVVYPEFYSTNVVSDDVMSRLKDRAAEALEQAARELLADQPVDTLIRIGRAADTVVEEAHQGGYNLVVMGNRGLSALEHLVLGSVTEAVLRRCDVPLLTVSS